MEIMAVHVALQTVSHVGRPALGGHTVIAQPRLCFRLRPILSRLRHAGTSEELSKQARWRGKWQARGLTGQLPSLTDLDSTSRHSAGRTPTIFRNSCQKEEPP